MALTTSVVITTFDRCVYLRRLLASLGHLDAGTFEVIVVNGPSTDATAEVLARYEGRLKVRHTDSRNLSRSRNVGIAAAAGDIVVFIDDDAHPARPDWLAQFVEPFESDPDGRLGCVGGSVLHRDGPNYEFVGGAASSYGFQSFVGTPDAPAPDGSSWIARPPGGNAAYRRRCLVELGGFDEHYVYYADETDLAARLWRAGYRCEHRQSNAIRHYSAPSERRVNEHDRNWDVIARSDAYFGVKNGDGSLPIRLVRTARYAPHKHFVHQIDAYRTNGEITRGHWIQLRRQWIKGVVTGMAHGAVRRRQTTSLSLPDEPLLPFRPATADHTVRPLTVALVAEVIPGQPGYGGIGRYTFDLAVALHEQGHRVHVICRDEIRRRYLALGFEIHGIAAESARRAAVVTGLPLVDRLAGYSVAVVDRLRDLHAEGVDVDVVHASNWNAEGVATIRNSLHPSVLVLVTPLGQVARTERWDVDDDMATVMELDQWQVRSADVVCAPSDGVLASYDGLNADAAARARVVKVPLGIEPQADRYEPPGPERPALLFVGRLERRKGAEVLLEVLPQLLADFPDWECHLVGADAPLAEGGTLRARFQDRHGAPLTDRVHFHGEVTEAELQSWYRRCELFVAPSLFESFGLILHEAMQHGKAVVACRSGGMPEAVDDGVEGLLVPPGDAEALGAALSRLMGDAPLRGRMGEAGRERVRFRQNATTMAAGFAAVYRCCVDQHGAPRSAARHRRWGTPVSIRGDVGWAPAWDVAGPVHEGHAGARVDVKVPSGCDLVVAVRNWSAGGTLDVEQGGEVVSRVHTRSSREERMVVRIGLNDGDGGRAVLRVAPDIGSAVHLVGVHVVERAISAR